MPGQYGLIQSVLQSTGCLLSLVCPDSIGPVHPLINGLSVEPGVPGQFLAIQLQGLDVVLGVPGKSRPS